ncbi:hypothetical protein ACLMJK_005774 [Lecanora helva]
MEPQSRNPGFQTASHSDSYQTFPGPAQNHGPPPDDTTGMASSRAQLDPYIRIASLEKDLEYARVEKATAELAVQYLVAFYAKGAAHTNGGADQHINLMNELRRANEDNLALKAKLEITQGMVTSLLTLGQSGPLSQPASGVQETRPESGPTQSVDLIDLAGTDQDSEKMKSADDAATLLGTSYDEISADECKQQVAEQVEQRSQSKPKSLVDAMYIHHFVSSKTKGIPNQSNKADTALIKEIPLGRAYRMKAAESSDQRSETSVEPNSDYSSHEYWPSAENPSSTSTSFVTADEERSFEESQMVNMMPEFALTERALERQRWPLADRYLTPGMELPKISDESTDSAELLPPKTRPADFAFAKSSLGPIIKGPCWKVGEVFASEAQRTQTLAFHKRDVGIYDQRQFPGFFKYGIRFEPDKDERDIYRTIVISNLSADTTMHQVLERVRGGVIISATLMDTMVTTGGKSALITFLHEYAALDYERHAKSCPIMINNTWIKVKVLPTPTWPIDASLRVSIDTHQHTRCLEIDNFPRHISASQLKVRLGICAQMKIHRIELVKMRGDGVLELYFSSINYAEHAFDILTSSAAFKSCKPRFVADPCAQPAETLNKNSGLCL